jgi:homoserine dehydrogenase
MQTIRLILTGLGNAGRNFLRLMESQRDLLRDVYGLALVLVLAGAADSWHVIAHAGRRDTMFELLGA